MTAPDPAHQSDVAEIAARLTVAQREAVLTGKAATEADGHVLYRIGVTRHDLRSRVKVYSALGLALKSHLQQEATNAR